MLRKFVIDKYKDKYSLIIQQQDQGNVDRVIFKAPNAEIDDITDDVREEFQKYLDQIGGPGRRRHLSECNERRP